METRRIWETTTIGGLTLPGVMADFGLAKDGAHGRLSVLQDLDPKRIFFVFVINLDI